MEGLSRPVPKSKAYCYSQRSQSKGHQHQLGGALHSSNKLYTTKMIKVLTLTHMNNPGQGCHIANLLHGWQEATNTWKKQKTKNLSLRKIFQHYLHTRSSRGYGYRVEKNSWNKSGEGTSRSSTFPGGTGQSDMVVRILCTLQEAGLQM